MIHQNGSNNQFILHDAIHGTIDLRFNLTKEDYEGLYEILNSTFLNRLRNIKQLGFASHSHPSADHSRYAHAIGTMHIMNALYTKISKDNAFNAIAKDVKRCFNVNLEAIKKHLLLAGLLQDIGELPYSQATQGIIKPNTNTIEKVNQAIGNGDKDLDVKAIFTIAALFDVKFKRYLEKLKINFPFLIYLITGHLAKETKAVGECQALRHMVDGEVDADRLDYVFRDGHHTYGYGGNPQAVIASLVRYDKYGPVFNDPGPISEYFLKRAHLWTSVYLIPENRFKNILLKSFLIEYFKSSIKNSILKKEISLSEFEDFDDIFLFSELNKILSDRQIKGQIRDKGQQAITTLLRPKVKYQWYWLPPINAQNDIKEVTIPDDVFFDTFPNYHSHKLFSVGCIQIISPEYEKLGKPVYLEQCSGAFNKNTWLILPKENCFLVFKPVKKGIGDAWKKFTIAEKDNSLYEMITFSENGLPRKLPFNTWDTPNFDGKKIFISYATSDLAIVNKIVDCLYRMKQHYYILRNPEDHLGDNFTDLSIEGIQKSEAILLVASINYYNKYQNATYVRKEMNKIISSNFNPVVLGIDKYDKIKDMPWKEIGYEADQPITEDLRNADISKIEKAVRLIVEKINHATNTKTKSF